MKIRCTAVAMFLLLSSLIHFGGCANMTATQSGAVGGGAVGGVAGALIGGSRKSTLIGVGVGALGGALLNDAAANKK